MPNKELFRNTDIDRVKEIYEWQHQIEVETAKLIVKYSDDMHKAVISLNVGDYVIGKRYDGFTFEGTVVSADYDAVRISTTGFNYVIDRDSSFFIESLTLVTPENKK